MAPSAVLARVLSGSAKHMLERKDALARASATIPSAPPEPDKIDLPPAPPSWKSLG